MCDSEVCSAQFGISKCAMCDFEVCSVQCAILNLEVGSEHGPNGPPYCTHVDREIPLCNK